MKEKLPGSCTNCGTFHEEGGPADYPRACRNAGTVPQQKGQKVYPKIGGDSGTETETCSRCGGTGGEWEYEGPHRVFAACYACSKTGKRLLGEAETERLNEPEPLPDGCQAPYFCVGCETGSHPWMQEEFNQKEYEKELAAEAKARSENEQFLEDPAAVEFMRALDAAKAAADSAECPF